MFNNNLRELYVSYPFLPITSEPDDPQPTPDWFRNVKYMRVMVDLPAQDPVDPGSNGDFIQATLTAISSQTVTVHVVCSVYGSYVNGSWVPWSKDINVPVFTGIDIPTGNSYLYTDTLLPTLTGLGYKIHPGCLVFQQSAPILQMETTAGDSPVRPSVDYTGDSIVQSGSISEAGLLWVRTALRLENGHNVEVSGSSANVVFTGAAGAGKGTWDALPYDEGETLDGYQGKGMRSINGHHGDVLMLYDKSVEIIPDGLDTLIIRVPTNASEA